jgi:predicted  nucleic acid-binding Zn-ribbon protein
MTSETTTNKSNNSGLKAIIAILALLLLGSLGYMYKLSTDSQNALSLVKGEKESVMKDLEVSKQSLDEAIASNTTLSDELIAERDKIQQLMAELEKTKGNDAATISKYKEEAKRVQAKIAVLMKQIEGLQKENANLNTKIDSTNTVLTQTRTVNDTLMSQNNNLAKTVERGSKLSVLNLQTLAVKQKNSGKQVETDKANRADVLKVSFMIAENQIAKSGDKAYYVQIIDSKSNVLGDKKTESFGEKSLTYSFIATVKYENKTVKIEKDLPVTNIQEGTFFVNVFDKSELVSKSSFTLR